jgi:hypothetical protein
MNKDKGRSLHWHCIYTKFDGHLSVVSKIIRAARHIDKAYTPVLPHHIRD